MTAGVVGLVAAYVALAVLLLSLNLRAAWPWPVKAAAILVTAGFFAGSFIALQTMLGWPTEQPAPAAFRLHAALVDEPDPRGDEPGAIYLWLSEVDGGGTGAEAAPRVHALPYSRELHKAVAEARRSLDEGSEVRGRRLRADDEGNADRRHPGIRLYTADAQPPPPKAATGPDG